MQPRTSHLVLTFLQQCPTLWRIYEYVTEAERKAILDEREQKSTLDIGAGGEGYIGPEYWCYNCGGWGHLGDVSSYYGSIFRFELTITINASGLRSVTVSSRPSSRTFRVQRA